MYIEEAQSITETNRTRSRILTSSRDRVGGLRRSHSRDTCDGTSRSIQIHTRRKRRIGSARSESICSVSNTHALETTVERIRSLGIAEGGRHRTIAHQELNLIQVNGSVLSSTKRHSVHRVTVGGDSTIELTPRACRMASSRSRVKLQEGSSSRVRSLNRKGSRMTAGITVRPNAERRDSGNEGTLARVGERSGDGWSGRIRVHEIELQLLLIPVLVTVKSIGELLFFHTPYNPATSYTFLICPCNHLVHSFQYRDYYY